MEHDPLSHSAPELAGLAHGLARAAAARRPIPPLTEAWPSLSPEVAYAIQAAGVRQQVEAGGRVVGYKLGFTSPAKQAAMGVFEPIYGTLLESMILPEGRPMELSRFLHPRVEPEVAFVMGLPLAGAHVSAEDVLRATASLHPALDVIDSRFEAFRFELPDVIADNASGAAFRLGPAVTAFAALDLTALRVETLQNGRPVASGTGRDVMGHPAEAVAWLVRALSARGLGLEPGMVVLSGALVAPVKASEGDRFEARFEALGNVTLSIERGG